MKKRTAVKQNVKTAAVKSVNVTLLTYAALLCAALLRRRCCWAPAMEQSIDISCPRVPTAANPPHAAAAVDGWDRHRTVKTRPCRVQCGGQSQ